MFGHGQTDIALIEAHPAERVLLTALVRALCPRYVIETGCYHGATAWSIGSALDIGHLDTMDIDDYSVGLARQACVGLPVTVHHCDSLDFMPDRPIDFLFLDSGVGDQRVKELDHFAPYLAPEGIVVMHDSRDLPWPNGYRFVNLPTARGMLVLARD